MRNLAMASSSDPVSVTAGPRDVVLCGVAGLLVIMAVIGFPYGLWVSGGILLGTAWVIWKLSATS
jgi:hypothetical protein